MSIGAPTSVGDCITVVVINYGKASMDFKKKYDEIITAVEAYLLANYPAAKNIQEVSEFLSTSDLYHNIRQQLPLDFTKEDLAELLIRNDYLTYHHEGGIAEWMIRSR